LILPWLLILLLLQPRLLASRPDHTLVTELRALLGLRRRLLRLLTGGSDDTVVAKFVVLLCLRRTLLLPGLFTSSTNHTVITELRALLGLR
jgi:hypothetical protein